MNYKQISHIYYRRKKIVIKQKMKTSNLGYKNGTLSSSAKNPDDGCF